MSYAKSINKLVKEASQLRENLYGAILGLPVNESVMAEKSENNFVVNTKDLDNGILSPYYYKYDKQYKMIVENLKKIQMNRILPYLKEILDKKVIIYDKNRYKLNPEVVACIRKVIQ